MSNLSQLAKAIRKRFVNSQAVARQKRFARNLRRNLRGTRGFETLETRAVFDIGGGGPILGDPEIIVTLLTPATTTELGGTARFSVVLKEGTSPPLDPPVDVQIPISSSDTTEGTVSTNLLTFTPLNRLTPQIVTVTGVDDFLVDGNIAYSIIIGAATGDSQFAGINPSDVNLTNIDNDTPGVVLSKTTVVTSESGGSDSFTVKLLSQPSAPVTIAIGSTNGNEGIVSPTSLVFTAADWNLPKTVNVTGVDDNVVDGTQAYSVKLFPAVSSDSSYSGFDAPDVSATNTDNDTAGFVVSPVSGVKTKENGATGTFKVRLTSQPVANVTINLSSSNVAEGTGSPSSLVFTALDWNVDQTVTVSGVDDAIDDGDVAYTIVTDPATSADNNYNTLNPADVAVTNEDDDTAGITVTSNPPLVTTEGGGTFTFSIVLDSQPTGNVSIPVSSSDAGEATTSVNSLLFTPANWATPQTVTVTGVDDSIDDGNKPYNVVLGQAASTDTKYSVIDPADLSATNQDNDTAAINVVATAPLVTTEAGGTYSFTVVLATQPTANVVIPVSSSNTAEGTVSVVSLTFTPANWSTPQQVVVTGVNDDVDDGDQNYTIQLGAPTTTDAVYAAINPDDVALSNTDNDTAGATVTPTSGLATTESGGTATFSIVLTSQPLANVTIGLVSSDTTEGTVAAPVVFTPANWNVPQVVTVTGVDDFIDDSDIGYTIQTSATSVDSVYNGIAVADVSVTNTDDDTAGITVSPTSGLQTTESGGTASFQIVLTSQPTGDVTIPLDTSDTTEGSSSAGFLTFTAANWNVPQTVTITGVDDTLGDGSVNYQILVGAASSSDANYNNVNPADVSITNLDNEVAPKVASFKINDGSAQRSMVKSVSISFDSLVTIDSGAFVVRRREDSSVVGLNLVQTVVAGKTVATLNFVGAGIIGGSLADGNYELTAFGDKIHLGIYDLDGDGNNTAGGNYSVGTSAVDKFFRFFGDSDGDRDVDSLDLSRFLPTRGKTSSDAGYLAYFDYDSNGTITANTNLNDLTTDYGQLYSRFKQRILKF